MFENSESGSEVDEPLVKKKGVLKSLKKKLSKQPSSELRNVCHNVEERERQLMGIFEIEEEAKEEDVHCNENENENNDENKNGNENDLEDVSSSAVLLNRNSTFNRTPERRNTDILDSAEVKDLAWTLRCLESGASPEATCQELKLSVCHIAAYFGDSGILGEVLRVQPDLFNRADSAGRMPLHYAVWEGHLDCMETILALNPGALTPRKSSKEKKQTEKIIETKISPDKLRFLHSTSGETIETYKELCDSSHSCSSVSKILNDVWSKCSPLHVACTRMQRDCVLALLACGADITIRDDLGRTPLDVCGLATLEAGTIEDTKSSHFVRIVEGIIRYGKHHKYEKELWLSNQNGTTPLHIAVILDSKRATKLLLDIRANPNLVNEKGQTPLHLAVSLQKADILTILANSPMYNAQKHIDKLDNDQYTALQQAVLQEWNEGVHILLEARASILIQLNPNSESALHLAAQVGNLDIIEKLIHKLGSAKDKWIDSKNAASETPLFVAIKNGKANCMRCLIHEGASGEEILGGFTVLHKAIETDNCDVLTSLLQVEKIGNLLNITDEVDQMTPLHMAARKNKPEYVRKLVDKGAELTIQTLKDGYTPLHIAAMEGHSEVIKVILSYDKEQNFTKIPDNRGWLPFYGAAYHCQRDSIELFLINGSNFSEVVPIAEDKKSHVISIIISSMPRSAEYLCNIFNKHMVQNKYSLDQPECEVTFDYSIIIPENEISQMKAISALFGYKSNFEIQKLILHPFIESFLFLKWSILKWFFLLILGIYGVFVLLLTDITINMYEPSYNSYITPLFLQIKEAVLLVLILLILLLEILFMRIKGWKYFRRVEGWVKPFSVIMAFLVIANDVGDYQHSASRLVCAIALLLSWMEITILLSRFPEFGYYFQMFSTVALRVVKVLALFGSFLIVGFSLIFWILIGTKKSFFSPWESLIKTIVMMTSEFDYSSMIELDETEGEHGSPLVVQLFFIVFLVCVPIVLMNLLLALAVSDVKDLETEGKIQRLSEQVEFLGNLEVLAHNLLTLSVNTKWKVDREITLYPGKPYWDPVNRLPRSIIESVCENLNSRKREDENEQLMKNMLIKMEESQNFIQRQEILNHKRHMELLNIMGEMCKEMHSQTSKEKTKSRWAQLFQ